MSILVSFRVKGYNIRNDSDLYFTIFSFSFPQKVWDISLDLWLFCIHSSLAKETFWQQRRGEWEWSYRTLFSPCKVTVCCLTTSVRGQNNSERGLLMLGTGILLGALCLLEGALTLCMCTYTQKLCVLYFFSFLGK